MNLLSSVQRQQTIELLQSQKFDLLIIGGGITGAGIALDAASRGMTVALVEKRDFASGTSSKSTKLIHGGLRYLKQFEVGLVREVGRERATVHKLAPHLVVPEKMLLPLVKGGNYGRFGTSVGLWVYDLLAGVKGDDRRKMLGKSETQKKEPLLRRDILQGSGYYAEYRTDDARLTIENIKTAVAKGAICLNYLRAEDFTYDGELINGVRCRDLAKDRELTIRADHIISAAGPWVDHLRRKDHSLKGKRLFLSKGVHIVVPHERFPVRQSVYFDNTDGRMIFAIPRQRATYIGTTDTPYDGDPDHIPITSADVDYLVKAVNYMFPDVHLREADVESSWAGLRPLIHEEGKSASEMSRKDEIFESKSGLISIAGGKLTGYRKMAERVIDFLLQRIDDRKLQGNHTDKIPLEGGPFHGVVEVEKYLEEIRIRLAGKDLPSYYPDYLVANYGKQCDRILDKMESFDDGTDEIRLVRAELRHAVEEELALTAMDFFNRRTGRLYFNMPSIARIREVVLGDMAEILDWGPEKRREEQEALDRAIERVTLFEPASAGKGS